MNPLHYACEAGSPTIARLITENEALVFVKCSMGKLPKDYLNNTNESYDWLTIIQQVERLHRVLPQSLASYSRFEIAAYFWFISFFVAFSYLPLYLSFFFGICLCVSLYRNPSPTDINNRILSSILNGGNFLTALTLIVVVIPNSTSWIFICLYLISHSLSYYYFYKTRSTSPGIVQGTESDIKELYSEVTQGEKRRAYQTFLHDLSGEESSSV